MFGKQSTQLSSLFGASVHTNFEAFVVLLATGWAADSWLEAGLIIVGVGSAMVLHVVGHWIVALAFGKGIDRIVFTRTGGIDFRGPSPELAERLPRTAAGPATNALLALGGYVVLTTLDLQARPSPAVEGLRIFAVCNALLGAVNFLPALPLDEGLILRSVLAPRMGPTEAHRWAKGDGKRVRIKYSVESTGTGSEDLEVVTEDIEVLSD